MYVWRGERYESNLSHFMTSLVFTDAFLMAGTIFGELYSTFCNFCMYKIMAGTVICEVWHCPRFFLGVHWNRVLFFLVMFACMRSIVLCMSRFVHIL